MLFRSGSSWDSSCSSCLSSSKIGFSNDSGGVGDFFFLLGSGGISILVDAFTRGEYAELVKFDDGVVSQCGLHEVEWDVWVC